MSYTFSDAELRRAAAKLREARLAAQGPPEGFEHEFSPRFEQAMEKLTRRGRRKAVWRKAVSIAASILLVLVIGASVTLAVSPQARAAFITWLREQYENSIIYRFWGGGKEETAEFPTYRIGWLPDGFELLREIDAENENRYMATYLSPDGEQIVFTYSPGTDRDVMEIEGDLGNGEVVSINGMYGEYVPSKDGLSGDLVWINETNSIVFTLSATLDKTTIISIAESVREVYELPTYQIGWLPDGFELLRETEIENQYTALYQSTDSKYQIIFAYAATEKWDGMLIHGDTTGNEQLSIQGLYGEYVPFEDGTGGDLIWIDEGRQIVLTLSATLDKDTMIAIAESVREITELPRYQVGWLPNGFELLQEIDAENENRYIAVYQSSGGKDQIVFMYTYITSDLSNERGEMEIQGDTENSEVLSINGMYGEYVPSKDETYGDLMWIDEINHIVFTLSATLDKTTIISIAESVRTVTELPYYQIGWLPDGLELTRTIEDENLYSAVYKFPDGKGIVFAYIIADERGTTEIRGNTENSEVISICGMHAEYVPSDDGTKADLIWIDEANRIVFTISSALDKATTIAIAESVFLVQ